MTAAERVFWNRVQRRAAALSPELRAALLRAFAQLREGLSDIQLTQLIRSGSVDRIVAEALSEFDMDRAFVGLRRELRDGVEAAGTSFARDLPAAARGIAFDVLNPRVIDAIRTLESRAVNTLKEGIRETVRAYIENGLRDGTAPATIARGLRSVIGLAPNQEQAVRNFRRALEGVPGAANPLSYALRDRRYDATLARLRGEGGIPPAARVDAMTEAYRRRMLAFNAQTNAQTLAMDAQKLGQHLTWRAAIERGDVDGNRLFKRWVAVAGPLGDGRNRPWHLAMHGEVVGWDEHFSNGQMVPGESDYLCRCIAIYFTAQDPLTARRAGRGAEVAGV